MNEDYWYYEEQNRNFGWVDAYASCGFGKQEAIAKMEQRKREYPRAVLRLAHCVRTRISYAKRRSA